MKRIFILSLFILAMQQAKTQKNFEPVEYVNPLMGTDSKVSLSNGNTYPVIGVPWGMNYWTPQTGEMGNGWQYQYSADKIRGFKQTHQPSPWMNDYGQFSIMPVTGKMKFRQDERASWFSHKAEIAKPYYYNVYLADADVSTEITTTQRSAAFRFTFPRSDSSFIVVDAFNRGSHVKIIPSQQKIIGYSTRYSRGTLPGFKNYFVIYIDKPFTVSFPWHDSTLVRDSLETFAAHAGGIIGFKTKKGEQVNLRVASSFISFEQAELNLQNEIGNKSFETIKEASRKEWNEVLGKIKVEGGTEDQIKTFYSCMYRTVQFPQRLYEIDKTGKPVHYSPYTGRIYNGYMFGGTGFWDTFRALYPFLNLVYPAINKEMQEGLLNDYFEGGWLPEWSSPGYANIMIGNNSASVVADAYIKGMRGYNIDSLYQALLHGANNEGPMEAVGRAGVKYYNAFGYVPYDIGLNENAARTLEYAYDDFTIYQLAKALKRPQSEIDLYAQRSQNFRNLFDPQTRLMRGKNRDGKFQSPFNPFKWGDAFTEGNSWHYSWSVFHDIEALKKLMGGNEMFVKMLDSVFNMPPVYDESYYGGVIHEIREMQIMNMGQYAHGNQPIQHMIYLYNYAGQPWKTQYWVREAMKKLYKPTPDGYCGDEDNGQTSAWYVFSALGFYPVCPGTDQYVLGTPLFNKATISLENGKQVIIKADDNSADNIYVSSLKFNGKKTDKNWVGHFDLMEGATLDFKMHNEPVIARGVSASSYPYSFSVENPGFVYTPPVPPAEMITDFTQRDSVTRDGYTLIFTNHQPGFDRGLKQRMIDTYFKVYPKQAERFNKDVLRRVEFIIDPKYNGVAAAHNGIVRYNPQWFKDHPGDIDVVTHEVMHITQSYPPDSGPGWVTEGIADYVRNHFGVANAGAGWSMPEVKPEHSYTSSYRITARFLTWLEKNVRNTIVNELDAAMRSKKYYEGIWKELTGKTVSELWQVYIKNPAL